MSITISESARYYDGKSGAAQDVTVILGGSAVYIMRGQETIASWSVASIRILSKPDYPAPATLTLSSDSDARLLIEDGKGWVYLSSRLMKNTDKRISLPTTFGAFLGYIIVSMAVLFFIFTVFPRVIEASAYLIPSSVEKMIGRHSVKQMIPADVCTNPKGQAALEKLLEKIKAQTKRDIEYHIFVADEKFIKNAFATPGGYIIFYSSLIDQAQSPEEIAGVLAHEISHIELYHTTKGMVRDFGFYSALKMMLGDIDYIEVAGFLNQMRYSKEDEQAADIHGVELLRAANIHSTGLISFFKHMDEGEPEEESEIEKNFFSFFSYFSSHPEAGQRIKVVKNMTSEKDGKPAMSNEDWKELRNICEVTAPLRLE